MHRSSRPAPRITSRAILVAGLTGALLLTGCSSSGDASKSDATSGPSGKGGTVEIKVSEADGCTVSPDTAPAGAITFHVTNVDAAGVTEVEVVSDQRIRGEKENLAPGFDATFSSKLDGGKYEIYCPGASTEKVPFTVTGKAAKTSDNVQTLLQEATVQYGDYISTQVDSLVEALPALDDAIKAGNLEAAKKAYAAARVFYEKIEPVAESFGDLDPDIDLREGDLEAGQKWTGFHPIEKALWIDGSTEGLGDLMDKLTTDVKDLQSRTKKLATNTAADSKTEDRYQPDEIANGAVSLLDEVQKSKITGEEEAYSHLDIVDFQANVEGSMQAFATLKPALDKIDASIVPTISTKFDELMSGVEALKDPASLGGYVSYDKVTDAQKKSLTDALLAVIEPLSDVSSKIASA
ncbi:iron uptake system component EfeO [Antricoccus suffuscus]|uniref:Iron uptake system component EfeO n=1 Tax=Antricoccus suffuscus TaxID=1629062 RepID=A0A2T0ZRW9_9ACTN|nr:iron uptake system protein EfeO [Antricoccus suffuscus]PRZ39100.1 iron uptake system component EfeO [Antricoccus suffuscus]